LALFGILRTSEEEMTAPKPLGTATDLDTILLPYTAMGTAMLLVLLLMLLRILGRPEKDGCYHGQRPFVDG
jgi:hypothetical protein